MGSVKSKEIEELGRVEREGLVFKTVPEEQVQAIVNKLDGKSAYGLAELFAPIEIDGKKYTGKNILDALNKHKDYITHISFVLTADDGGNVHIYLRFEGNRYALRNEARTGDESAQLLTKLSATKVEGDKLAEAIIKDTGFFVLSKRDESLNSPVKWKV